MLIVSAFPEDYVPTRTSLIGALDRIGLSVAQLAAKKEFDLRDTSSCWVSRDVSDEQPDVGFRRILCFEPASRGTPPETVGDVFRAIAPLTTSELRIRSIATPLLASGDQRYDPELMLNCMLDASLFWLRNGLPLETVKIIVYSAEEAERLRHVFVAHAGSSLENVDQLENRARPSDEYDYFVSYSHQDVDDVMSWVQALREAKPGVRIFVDKLCLEAGQPWQSKIFDALEKARRVIAFYSPDYLRSKICMEEFNMAHMLHRERDYTVLTPIYLRSADLQLLMRSLQYVDCREGDRTKLLETCAVLQ